MKRKVRVKKTRGGIKVKVEPRFKRLTVEEAGLTNNQEQKRPQINTTVLDVPDLVKLKAELLSDSGLVLDHKQASQYVDLPIFSGERQVADSHVQFLYDEMQKGTFEEALVILATAQLGSTTYKINGQHTCWAVLFMPLSYKLKVRELRYKVKDIEQLRLLYSCFDRNKARSDAHIQKTLMVETKMCEGLHASMLKKYNSGFLFWQYPNDDVKRRLTPDQVKTILEKNHFDLYRSVALFLQEYAMKDAKELLRQPVVAALFGSFERLPTKASEFWQPVADGIGFQNKTDPRYKLRKWLADHTTGAPGYTRSKEKKSVADETMFRICCVAWNHWRLGNPVTTLKTTKTRVAFK